MRALSEAMRSALAQPATTLASAWRLTRRDGTVFGFTDHDEDIAFGGTVFSAATGWTAGETEGALGLAAGTHGVEGALSSVALREEDIAAGLFDGASVEIFRVDWQRPEDAVLMERCDLGEVTRGGGGFSAELRGIAARLDRQHGRYYRRRCDAVLGDRRCGVDLSAGGWTRTGRLVAVDGEVLVIEGLGALDVVAFERGRIALGAASEFQPVRGIRTGAEAGTLRIALGRPTDVSPDVGSAVRLKVGCDRSFRTCRERFANSANFRGFPHLPGSDAALGVAKRDALHDGSPVVA
ncbi:DUF2163 domain-containing protein [Aureimonas sp. AU12]|uniref:DUF2163 domain-containing protein n=1 Tax=Aureimonas sp. AU12 TaxID=1638161 RepID=UPI000780FF7E|nr:DUF2163 domain-containing protein [Aureimonas sp. AU12]